MWSQETLKGPYLCTSYVMPRNPKGSVPVYLMRSSKTFMGPCLCTSYVKPRNPKGAVLGLPQYAMHQCDGDTQYLSWLGEIPQRQLALVLLFRWPTDRRDQTTVSGEGWRYRAVEDVVAWLNGGQGGKQQKPTSDANVGPFSKRFSFFKKTIGQNVFLMGRVNSQRKLHVRRFRCVWVLPHHVWVLHIQSFFCKWSQIILDILDRAGLLFFLLIFNIFHVVILSKLWTNSI